MLRIVHFDLKGAPPKLQYFEQVLKYIKFWGATGVLLEWEDTFPYSGSLKHLGSESNIGGDEMYSIAEVCYILQVCKDIGLEVIQLVQTIGHLEFVLKHSQHEHLREYPRSPSIICPEKLVSKELIKVMVMQALTVQPDAKYFHIGADEVCHIAYCEDCRKKIKRTSSPLDHWCIYLNYIRDLVRFIKRERPHIKVLMWDDMIRVMSPDILEGYRELSEIVQPVVWNYGVSENFRFPPDMWAMYKKYFPKVWAGSAFKGANESSQQVSPVSRYVQNQDAWIREMRLASSQVDFKGVIFTGWSRFDHYATLCELLPTSLNSLANCIKCFVGNSQDNYRDLHRENTLPDEQWVGKNVDQCVRNMVALREKYHRVSCGDLKTTWLNNWQLNYSFLNMFQVDNIDNYVEILLLELKNQKQIAYKEFTVIYGPRTRTEWIQTHFGNMETDLASIQHVIRRVRGYDPRYGEFCGTMPANVQHLPSTSTVGCAPLIVGNPSMAASVITHGPSMAAQMPSVVAQMPSVVAQMPSVVAQRPSVVAQMPSVVAQMPSVVAHGPSTSALVKNVPSTVAYVPYTVHDVP